MATDTARLLTAGATDIRQHNMSADTFESVYRRAASARDGLMTASAPRNRLQRAQTVRPPAVPLPLHVEGTRSLGRLSALAGNRS